MFHETQKLDYNSFLCLYKHIFSDLKEKSVIAESTDCDHYSFCSFVRKFNEEDFNKQIHYSSYSTIEEAEIANTIIDEVFIIYLIETSEKSNFEYFEYIFKFVLLFREYINKTNRGSNPEDQISSNRSKPYSQANNCEMLLTFFNSFITDLIEPFEYFGIEVKEFVEIIMHFSYWLYLKGYTNYRILLENHNN